MLALIPVSRVPSSIPARDTPLVDCKSWDRCQSISRGVLRPHRKATTMADAASIRLTAGDARSLRNRDQGPTRNVSTRSSGVYNDDYMPAQPYNSGQGQGSLGLRSTTSRYSLNEQFAATRREFEFGFDDGASTFDRSTIASEAFEDYLHNQNQGVHDPFPDQIVDYYDPLVLRGRQYVIDPYDLLVLPKNPSARQIRRAYFRLFVLIYPDSHPPKLRKAASVYLTLVQDAFEQLIGPDKRLLQDVDEISTADLVLDEPGRFQIYQLWRLPLASCGQRLLDNDNPGQQDVSNQKPAQRQSHRDHLERLGLGSQRVRRWIGKMDGILGLGVKFDMGSPDLFESGARGFSRFSILDRQFLSLIPIRVAPRLEYSTGLPLSLRTPDSQGSWALSTAAETRGIGASVKYSIDIEEPVWPSLRNNAPSSEHKQITNATLRSRPIRVEAELSSGWIWSKFLALRCLKRMGRFSRLGFEIGFGAYHLHLSLYWSRLGQRIRLPLLASLHSTTNPRLLFWTAVVPFMGFAAWDMVARGRRFEASKLQMQQQLADMIQDRRAEADDITILLSANVEAKQAVERANHGLVILSAKYGVKKDDSWGLEEVADVTTALAALVDDSQILIPSTVDKNNILGFWDPVPGLLKTLHVRYSFQGREAIMEVPEQAELVLPPS